MSSATSPTFAEAQERIDREVEVLQALRRKRDVMARELPKDLYSKLLLEAFEESIVDVESGVEEARQDVKVAEEDVVRERAEAEADRIVDEIESEVE
jgi:hypothetical protein